jgi:hypothetical protein
MCTKYRIQYRTNTTKLIVIAHYCRINLLCLQKLKFSSPQCGWKAQTTCVLPDDNPKPPGGTHYQENGWKLVKEVMVTNDGADFLIPKNQLMLSTATGYRNLIKKEDRLLNALDETKVYLVWYHHLASAKKRRTK